VNDAFRELGLLGIRDAMASKAADLPVLLGEVAMNKQQGNGDRRRAAGSVGRFADQRSKQTSRRAAA
jgi:hypothetical protein